MQAVIKVLAKPCLFTQQKSLKIGRNTFWINHTVASIKYYMFEEAYLEMLWLSLKMRKPVEVLIHSLQVYLYL